MSLSAVWKGTRKPRKHKQHKLLSQNKTKHRLLYLMLNPYWLWGDVFWLVDCWPPNNQSLPLTRWWGSMLWGTWMRAQSVSQSVVFGPTGVSTRIQYKMFKFPTNPSRGTSMVPASSTYMGRQSLTSWSLSGVNSSQPLSDRPGATNWNTLDAVNLNNWRENKHRKQSHITHKPADRAKAQSLHVNQ